jgi:hypothetical protein
VLFQQLIPELIPVSHLRSESGWENVTQLAGTGKKTILTSIVYGLSGGILKNCTPFGFTEVMVVDTIARMATGISLASSRRMRFVKTTDDMAVSRCDEAKKRKK